MPKAQKFGRPPLPEGAAKTVVVRARVSEAERAQITAAAQREGQKLSDWVRKTLLDAS
jgi:uncharacterized protein (DUF1778 family)